MKAVRFCLCVTLFFLCAFPLQAAEPPERQGPEGVVRAFYTQLVTTMKQGEALGIEGRYKKLDPPVRTAFNLPLMAHAAVGPSWSAATTQEQEDLIAAFTDYSIASYAARFPDYHGEQFTVTGQKPSTAGGVIVETTLAPPDNAPPVALNYLLRTDKKGAWRIVDVFLNGAISEMATRRAEFSSIARRDGMPALTHSLSIKAKQGL